MTHCSEVCDSAGLTTMPSKTNRKFVTDSIGGTATLALVATAAAAPASLAAGLHAGLVIAAVIAVLGALAVLAVAGRSAPATQRAVSGR
jgi:hypothetical protein